MRRFMNRRGWLGAFGLALVLAASPALAAESVKLKVAVIHATQTAGGIDPALAKISRDLEKAFGGYKSFKQLDKTELKLDQGVRGTVKLPNGQDADFTYKGAQNERHALRLGIPASKVDVDLSAPLRKMFYQAGIPHEGGILILALFLTPP